MGINSPTTNSFIAHIKLLRGIFKGIGGHPVLEWNAHYLFS
ncbi:hypothetical protein [Desulfosporosinus sp. FKA]|nr:hypothetical protein [Desulfosporosinus sp. FKA]